MKILAISLILSALVQLVVWLFVFTQYPIEYIITLMMAMSGLMSIRFGAVILLLRSDYRKAPEPLSRIGRLSVGANLFALMIPYLIILLRAAVGRSESMLSELYLMTSYPFLLPYMPCLICLLVSYAALLHLRSILPE